MIQKLKSPKEKELEYKEWLESLPEDERKKTEEDDKLIEERDRQRIVDEEEYKRKEEEFSKIIIRNAVEQNICGEYSSDLELPEEAQILLPYSFYSCRNIQAAYIHENIRVCTKESFYETDDILLTNAAYKKENGLMINTHLGILLYADNDLEDVIVPEGVVEIAPYAFSGCNMKSIKLPESLEMIGEYCFTKCEYLQTIVFPKKIKKIAKGTLCNCASLREVILQGLREL